MTASLTSILPALAPTFGLSPTHLYERKRRLIKLGLLPSPQGRGSRSGALAEPHAVALMIIATLAADGLAETDDRIRALAFAPLTASYKRTSMSKGKPTDRCLWTGAGTFAEAVSWLLSPAAPIARAPKPQGHTSIRVYRHERTPSANIQFVALSRPGQGFSEFGHRDERVNNQRKVEAEFPFEALRSIREILKATTEGAA